MNNLVELHLHLDGALSIDNCKKIAKIQNIDIPSEEEISKLMITKNCHDLNEFLAKFEFPLSLLQTTDGIKNAVKNLCDELLEQGIIYSEIRFAPQLHISNGLTIEEIVNAAIDGLNSTVLRSNLILCCMRGNNNHEMNIETVRIAKKYLNKGVCAIDLAGAEGLYPTKDYEDIFEYANELEIPFTIHAGEADGANSVYDAIRFGAKRIGHGVRSIEDPRVINFLKEKNITLEICPTSNICTSVYDKISDIPIKEFLNNGINITINTDDPIICNTTLKNELNLVKNTFDLSDEDIIKLQLNAINASFASEEIKNEIIKMINE
ncbi:MAG: adenosine deaminase [Bacilli bacterium]|nr:adenosine deaminase [Bacilli bacterium]